MSEQENILSDYLKELSLIYQRRELRVEKLEKSREELKSREVSKFSSAISKKSLIYLHIQLF